MENTYDANGKPIGVFIPINEWEEITDQLKKIKTPEKDTAKKSAIIDSIRKGMKQVRQIEKGKIESIPLQKLLDEL